MDQAQLGIVENPLGRTEIVNRGCRPQLKPAMCARGRLAKLSQHLASVELLCGLAKRSIDGQSESPERILPVYIGEGDIEERLALRCLSSISSSGASAI
jgi:hypothetical protein